MVRVKFALQVGLGLKFMVMLSVSPTFTSTAAKLSLRCCITRVNAVGWGTRAVFDGG